MIDSALFLISAFDHENSEKLRNETRPVHLDYISKNNHKVALAGPYVDENGISVGSLYVIHASDEGEAEEFINSDPYSVVGLFRDVQIRRWRLVIDNIHG
tara:strand:+ start:273 stop:572 length:300 start_codon:yes stop_codon:yes gene_type:complete